jgi:predicted nuclease with TOPRIM domain
MSKRNTEPVRHTCPDIDRLQKTIKEIRDDFATFNDTCDVSDFISSMENASWELKSISETIEKLCDSNSSLRYWGSEMYENAEKMENEKDEWENKYAKLEGKVSDLEITISDLEDTVFKHSL